MPFGWQRWNLAWLRVLPMDTCSQNLVKFGLLFWKRKFLTADISDIICQSAAKFCMVRGIDEHQIVRDFGELWCTILQLRYHVATSISLHWYTFYVFLTNSSFQVLVFFVFLCMYFSLLLCRELSGDTFLQTGVLYIIFIMITCMWSKCQEEH